MDEVADFLATVAHNITDSAPTEEPPYDPCQYDQPPLTEVRIWLVTIFGSAVSFVSVVENLLLFMVFLTKKAHRNNHNMYLMLLAFFDIFISIAYMALMSVNVLSDYLESPALVAMWFSYMVPMITISHIAMTSASFLIIAASFERYCLTTNSHMLRWAQRNRKLIAAGAVLLGIISKGSIFIEFDILHYEECAGKMTEWQMQYKPFVFNTPYHIVWRFWYRNVVTIFVPFFTLAYFNVMIVRALSHHGHHRGISRLGAGGGIAVQLAGDLAKEQTKRKAVARAATRTLVLVVCCYLASNIVNVILTIWEHVDKDSLFSTYINFYAIAVDMVSLLTTMACAFRLPIYLACQAQLRSEIFGILSNAWKCITRRRKAFDHEKLMHSTFTSSSYVKSRPEKNKDEEDCNDKEDSPMALHEPPPPGSHFIPNGVKAHENGNANHECKKVVTTVKSIDCPFIEDFAEDEVMRNDEGMRKNDENVTLIYSNETLL